ncbi:MAG: RNA methyltransferase [Candidatus Sumerlaeia bacterium]|nr:RNA methyltransferase [Candidatus Sumerlaeia bacterium]
MAIYTALVHYPILDKKGRIVATSITNLDIHDLARAAFTYGIARFYIVTPIPGQQWFAHRVIQHWLEGFGAEYNPTRKTAMQIVTVVPDLEAVVEDIESQAKSKDNESKIYFVGTTARVLPEQISYSELRKKMNDPESPPAHYCIVFGTGWGLHPSLLLDMDYILKPIKGCGEYNHLSVRSAAGIILDRLFAPQSDR